ncbi:MAG: VOC family protein, partial [Thermoanaerobaculia bacterium]
MADYLVLTLDCADLDVQTDFWCAALGYRLDGGVAQYRALVHPDGTQPKLLLQRV